MSIKRYAPYKNDARKWDTARQQKLRELQATLKEREKSGGWLVKGSEKSDNGEQRWQAGEEGKPKKRKGKKERMKARAAAAGVGEDGDDNGGDPTSRDGTSKPEGHKSYGGSADIQKSASMNSKEKESGRKRKREDLEGGEGALGVSVESASGDVDLVSQGQEKQRRGKEKSEDTGKKNDDGKAKKKRRRKHKKGGEDVSE